MSTLSQPDAAPWTLGRLLSWTAEFLSRQDVDDPRLSAEILLAHAANCRRIDLYARFERVLDAESLTRFRDSVKRAGNHEPIAYLVGEKEFFSLRFHVTPGVLIPRAETEELVACVIDLCRQNAVAQAFQLVPEASTESRCHDGGWEAPRFWDLGTGSGCIAIAVLSQLAKATCLATDTSAAALEVARRNAERHAVANRIMFHEVSQLALPASLIPEGGFHVLMCNPPYIPAVQIATLDRAVRDFEPHIALTDEADGLSFYRVIADESLRFLADPGYVVLEIGDGTAVAVMQIMTSKGFVHVQTRKDCTVGKERVLVFRKSM
jgi:release factor glutamine methyltransferase